MEWRARLLGNAAVVLVALTSALTLVRLLQMPVGLGYDTVMVMRLNEALYPHLTYVGGAVESLAVVVTITLAIAERRTNRFRLTLPAAALSAGALMLWVTVVQPANGVFDTWARQPPPPDWHAWRLRWELGQIGNLVLVNVALLLLLAAVTGRRTAGRDGRRAMALFLRRLNRGKGRGDRVPYARAVTHPASPEDTSEPQMAPLRPR